MKSKLLLVGLLIVLIALGAYLLPALVATPAASAAGQTGGSNAPANIPAVGKFAGVADLESTFQSIYDQVHNSVVEIDVTSAPSPASGTRPRGGFGQSQPQQGLGSGFVWDNQGHIVTNNHVVEGANQIVVTFSDGTIASAKVVGTDPQSDLAVIKIDVPAEQLRPVQMADSNQLKVGQLTIAIGNPFGEENTMTTGIVSALGRSLPVDNGANGAAVGPTYTIPDVIQTDASINPGNSGGVLLNIQGQVIGVTAAIESPAGTSAGIGFAIPSSIVQKVVPALIKDGKYEHPYLGISGTTLSPSIARAMNMNANQRGALVAGLTKGGPAEKAGVRASTKPATVDGIQTQVGGDVITAIDGHAIKTFDELVAYLARSTEVNQTVTLTVLRDGKEQAVKVTLMARPTQ